MICPIGSAAHPFLQPVSARVKHIRTALFAATRYHPIGDNFCRRTGSQFCIFVNNQLPQPDINATGRPRGQYFTKYRDPPSPLSSLNLALPNLFWKFWLITCI